MGRSSQQSSESGRQIRWRTIRIRAQLPAVTGIHLHGQASQILGTDLVNEGVRICRISLTCLYRCDDLIIRAVRKPLLPGIHRSLQIIRIFRRLSRRFQILWSIHVRRGRITDDSRGVRTGNTGLVELHDIVLTVPDLSGPVQQGRGGVGRIGRESRDIYRIMLGLELTVDITLSGITVVRQGFQRRDRSLQLRRIHFNRRHSTTFFSAQYSIKRSVRPLGRRIILIDILVH